jgi:hypothetical protein
VTDAIQEIVSRLRQRGCEPKQNGDGYWAFCPVHDPNKRGSMNLSVKLQNGLPSLKCLSNCDPSVIRSEIGLGAPRPATAAAATAQPSRPSMPGTAKEERQKEVERQLSAYKPKTFGEVSQAVGSLVHLWPNWFLIGNLSMVYSKPKFGKTRVYIRLIKTLWFAETWPDGAANIWPAGSKTLIIPYDRNHQEIAAEMKLLGIPDEAAICPHDPSDPLGVSLLDLCDPFMVDIIDRILTTDKTIKLVVVDTLTYASNKSLSKPEDMKAVLDGIITLAAKHAVAMLVLIHENRDGEALGRRICERARVLMKLERYSESDPTRLRLFVKESNFKERPALTVVHKDTGVEFEKDQGQAGSTANLSRCYDCARYLVDYLWKKGVGVEVEFGTVIDALGHAGYAGTINEENRWSDRKLFSRAVSALNDEVEALQDLRAFKIERREGSQFGRKRPVILYSLKCDQVQPTGAAY